MDKLHYIHSQGGRIGGQADTGTGDVDAIIDALRKDPRRHLAVYFHGGLVSKKKGLKIAERLLEEKHVFAPTPTSGAYAVFYIWESGAWGTIRNNLAELADEPVFKHLLRKLAQFTLEKIGARGLVRARSTQGSADGALKEMVLGEFDAFWADPKPATIPFSDFAPAIDAAAVRSASGRINIDDIEDDLQADKILLGALATLPDLPPGARSAFSPQGTERRTTFSELAARELSAGASTRGLVSTFLVAQFIVKVLIRTLHRFASGRDHGLYATCVEELIRTFKIAGSGVNEWGKALEWNRMKQDAADAFGPDPDIHAGTAFLARLGAALKAGGEKRLELDRITLIGHSTGAIHIAYWLAASAHYLPSGVKQDIVFLAPALTYDLFADTLRSSAGSIGGFRMFAMRDEFERKDQVLGEDEALPGAEDWRRYIYPSSLLYLVSGILESRRKEDGSWVDEPDMPIVGMERFFSNTSVYNDREFPSVAAVRKWLKADEKRSVWSIRTGKPEGLNSECIDHGSFDSEKTTMDSLSSIVVKGF